MMSREFKSERNPGLDLNNNEMKAREYKSLADSSKEGVAVLFNPENGRTTTVPDQYCETMKGYQKVALIIPDRSSREWKIAWTCTESISEYTPVLPLIDKVKDELNIFVPLKELDSDTYILKGYEQFPGRETLDLSHDYVDWSHHGWYQFHDSKADFEQAVAERFKAPMINTVRLYFPNFTGPETENAEDLETYTDPIRRLEFRTTEFQINVQSIVNVLVQWMLNWYIINVDYHPMCSGIVWSGPEVTVERDSDGKLHELSIQIELEMQV